MARFENIQVGDRVLVHTWSGGFSNIHDYTPCSVVKVNKKTFKLDKYETRTFTKDYGSVYGGDYLDRIEVIPYNEEVYQKCLKDKEERSKRNQFIGKVKQVKFDSLTTDQLERICSIIDE